MPLGGAGAGVTPTRRGAKLSWEWMHSTDSVGTETTPPNMHRHRLFPNKAERWDISLIEGPHP